MAVNLPAGPYRIFCAELPTHSLAVVENVEVVLLRGNRDVWVVCPVEDEDPQTRYIVHQGTGKFSGIPTGESEGDVAVATANVIRHDNAGQKWRIEPVMGDEPNLFYVRSTLPGAAFMTAPAPPGAGVEYALLENVNAKFDTSGRIFQWTFQRLA